MSKPSKKSANLEPLVSRSAANEKFRKTLRLFVGRGRHFSVKELSIGTGIQRRMIESFMAPVDSADYRKPDLEEVLSLMKFLRGAFGNELLEIADLGAFDLPDPEDPDTGRLAVEAAQDAAELVSIAAEGGNVTDLRDVANRMMVRGATLRDASLRGQPGLFERKRA